MTFDQTTIDMLLKGIWETIYMVSLSSFLSYVIGIPVGIALVVTDRDGISPFPLFNKVLGVVINLLRSIPFIILLVMVIPYPHDRRKDHRTQCSGSASGDFRVSLHQPYGGVLFKGG